MFGNAVNHTHLLIMNVYHRGETFRAAYASLDILRSTLSSNPWVGLTASCDAEIKSAIESVLGIKDFILESDL